VGAPSRVLVMQGALCGTAPVLTSWVNTTISHPQHEIHTRGWRCPFLALSLYGRIENTNSNDLTKTPARAWFHTYSWMILRPIITTEATSNAPNGQEREQSANQEMMYLIPKQSSYPRADR
jgi:hypothetical protein